MKYIIGNWKMNGDAALLNPFADLPERAILCVPFTLLGPGLGAEDCSAFESGAFTGEISAKMIAATGAKYCIVGHSERRRYFKETDEIVKEKALRCIENGIIPIVCVENPNQTPDIDGEIIIAYEPVSAIGTGKIPSAIEIENVHNEILKRAPGRPVLYGGSVNPSNAAEILAIPNVGGVLVGGASLDPIKFKEIINARK